MATRVLNCWWQVITQKDSAAAQPVRVSPFDRIERNYGCPVCHCGGVYLGTDGRVEQVLVGYHCANDRRSHSVEFQHARFLGHRHYQV